MTNPEPESRGTPWSQWEPLDALVGIGMVVIGLIVAASITVGLTDGEPQSTLLALFLQGIVFVAVPLAIASSRTSGKPWRIVGFNPFRASDLWLVAGALLVQFAVTILVSAFVMPDQDTIIEDANFTETTLAAVLAAIAVVILAPVAEEALFRGLIFGAIRRRMPFIGAAVISGLLFGAVHLSSGNVVVAGLLSLFGVLLAFLYERTGSLGPPIALHMVNNAIAIIPLLT